MAKFEVGKDKHIKSISDAIVAANDGDEIIIEPDTYSECFEINKELYIHSSVELTKAKNNFAFEDIPIVCIKSFETLKISSNCKIENLLFTQKRNLIFDALQDILVHPENSGKDINTDKISRKTDDKDFLAMVEISADVTVKNCFFIFGSYHGVVVLNGESTFERTLFSNNYADNVLVLNNAKIELSNACCSKCAINGNGLCCCGESEVDVKDSSFLENEGSGIALQDSSKATIENDKIFYSASDGICVLENAIAKIIECNISNSKMCGIGNFGNIVVNNCEVHNNDIGGIVSNKNASAKIQNCLIYKHATSNKVIPGIYGNGKTTTIICNSKIYENDYGMAFAESSTCAVSDSECYDSSKSGLVLNGNAKFKIKKSHFSKNQIGFYVQDTTHFEISDTDISDNSLYGFFLRGNSTSIINFCKIRNCKKAGIYEDDSSCAQITNVEICAKDIVLNEEISAGLSILGESNTIVSSCKIFNCGVNGYGIILGNSAKGNILNTEISENNYGIVSSDESNAVIEACNVYNCSEFGIWSSGESGYRCYKVKILNNENGVVLQGTGPNYFIHCDISNNNCDFVKLISTDKYDLFINCAFNNNKRSLFFGDKEVKKVSQNEENKIYEKVFKPAFELQVEIQKKIDVITQSFMNTSISNSFFNDRSIDVIFNCISTIIRKLGLFVFYPENKKRLISLCRDFYPNNETELNFIKELCEENILKMLATKQMSDDFDERFNHICKKYMSEEVVNEFATRIKQIFDIERI